MEIRIYRTADGFGYWLEGEYEYRDDITYYVTIDVTLKEFQKIDKLEGKDKDEYLLKLSLTKEDKSFYSCLDGL